MKKAVVLFSALFMLSVTLFGQKAEVLYFKANLACCHARACHALERDVKSTIEKNFTSKEVAFRQVKLNDEKNKELVEKHNARSQTVVIVVKKRRKETVVDLSDIVRRYARSRNRAELEKELVAKIKEALG